MRRVRDKVEAIRGSLALEEAGLNYSIRAMLLEMAVEVDAEMRKPMSQNDALVTAQKASEKANQVIAMLTEFKMRRRNMELVLKELDFLEGLPDLSVTRRLIEN